MFIFIAAALVDEDDRGAFEQFYVRSRDRLYRYALKLTQSHEAAEDCLEDAYISLAKSFHELSSDGEDSLLAYVTVTLRNRVYDGMRRDSVERKYAPKLYFEPETDFDSSLMAEQIKAAIMSLEQKYRDVMYLYYVHERSTKQIAEALDISEQAVRQRLTRARRMTREALGVKEE